jgi:hypothetical protein
VAASIEPDHPITGSDERIGSRRPGRRRGGVAVDQNDQAPAEQLLSRFGAPEARKRRRWLSSFEHANLRPTPTEERDHEKEVFGR